MFGSRSAATAVSWRTSGSSALSCRTMLKTEKDPYVWYDMFIRPVEIIFARKTILHGKLIMAMKCQQHAKDFYHLVCNLTNIPHSTPLTSTECIEEMSKIRHLTAKQMSQTSATDVPIATTQKVRLQSSDIRTWNVMCDEDAASSSASAWDRASSSSVSSCSASWPIAVVSSWASRRWGRNFI